MSSKHTFDDVLSGIHNAVIEAQKLTEQQHHRQLLRYFEQGVIHVDEFDDKDLVEKLVENKVLIYYKQKNDFVKFKEFIVKDMLEEIALEAFEALDEVDQSEEGQFLLSTEKKSLSKEERVLFNMLGDIKDISGKQKRKTFFIYRKSRDGLGLPICQKIKIPNTNPAIKPTDKDYWVDVNVPLISIIPPSSIKIKEMTVQFKVRLAGFLKKKKDGGYAHVEYEQKDNEGPLQVDLGNGFFARRSALAHIKVTFDSTGTPETLLKIIDNYEKAIT